MFGGVIFTIGRPGCLLTVKVPRCLGFLPKLSGNRRYRYIDGEVVCIMIKQEINNNIQPDLNQ